MKTTFALLVFYLLAISFAVVQTEKGNLTTAPTVSTTSSDVNATGTTTPSNSTVNATAIPTLTGSTTQDKGNSTETTAATSESTSHPPSSPSTTVTTPVTNGSEVETTTGTHTPVFTSLTTPAIETTGYISTTDTTASTTDNSTDTVITTPDSNNRTAEGLGLNMSERTLTIVFSAVLGAFAFGLVGFMFHRCKQKIQYLHQPLNNTDDTDAFVADNDTLVISGGLYDGHPIYDNVPTATEDQSQFRLEFLH